MYGGISMHPTHRLAELIVVAWKLGGEGDRIPTSHGILDRALKDVWDSGDVPDWAASALHFADSRVGLQCIELPDVLEWAQRSQLTSAPNPSYESTQVQISTKLAERFVKDLSITVEQAKQFGERLRSATQKARRVLAAFEFEPIEDY
jgi:hypothetical protein